MICRPVKVSSEGAFFKRQGQEVSAASRNRSFSHCRLSWNKTSNQPLSWRSLNPRL